MVFPKCIVCGGRGEADAFARIAADDELIGWAHPACSARLRDTGFDQPEDGSAHRYAQRRAERPWAAHTFWWIVHNAAAHPLIAFVPRRRCFELHDWTSRKMHGA